MNTALQFEFLVDKEKNTLTVKREFIASRQLIWDVHTKIEYLEKWFAPKPLTTKTKLMDFREGGRWHYAMVDPEGKEYWGLTDYLEIHPIDWYTALDAFSDESGEINPDLPRATWEVTFSDFNNNVMVQTVVTYKTLNDLEKVLEMGMQEGLTATLNTLDEVLAELQK